jgi:hypothetical protein
VRLARFGPIDDQNEQAHGGLGTTLRVPVLHLL